MRYTVHLLIHTETERGTTFTLNTGELFNFTKPKLIQNAILCQGTEIVNTEFQENQQHNKN